MTIAAHGTVTTTHGTSVGYGHSTHEARDRLRGCCGSWSLAGHGRSRGDYPRLRFGSLLRDGASPLRPRHGPRPQACGRAHGDFRVSIFNQTPSRAAPRRCRAIGRGRRWAPEWAGPAPSGRRSLHRPQQARCCSLSAPAESLPTCPRAPPRVAIGKSEYPDHGQQLSRSPGLAASCMLYAPREPLSGMLRIDPEMVQVILTTTRIQYRISRTGTFVC